MEMEATTVLVSVGIILARVNGLNYTTTNETQPEGDGNVGATDQGNSTSEAQLLIIALSAAVVLMLIVLIAVGIFVYLKYYKEPVGLTSQEISDFIDGIQNEALLKKKDKSADEITHLTPYNSNQYEVSVENYSLDPKFVFRAGAFGIVLLRGRLNGKSVAVKTMKKVQRISQLKALLCHLKLFIYLGNHDNIVQFLGSDTKNLDKGVLYIFVQYYPLGNLEKFLNDAKMQDSANQEAEDQESMVFGQPITTPAATTSRNTFTFTDLIDWSVQIASGMAYLAGRRVIHGDLRAKNLLLDENRQVKITDFGLVVELLRIDSEISTKVIRENDRWRWMAPELITSQRHGISLYIDNWSYGITLWEIFSLGDCPYGETHARWKDSFADELINGEFRLRRTKQASEFIYQNIMSQCWKTVPKERMSFPVVIKRFGEIVNYPKTLISQTHQPI